MENQKDNQNDLQKLGITKDQIKEDIGHCDKHGEYTLKKFQGLRGEIKFSGVCQKCIDERNSEKALERTRHIIERVKKYANIPDRFKNYTLESFETNGHINKIKVLNTVKEYIQNFNENKSKGRSIILYGAPGTGKTMLAICIMNAIMNKSYCAFEDNQYSGDKQLNDHAFYTHYITEYGLFRRIKNTWSEKIETEDSIIDYLCGVHLLVIDEIGVSFGSEADKILLYQVINGRYEKMLPTILMSNLNVQDLTKHCGERVMDRMRENDGISLLLNWESYRK